MKWWHIIGIIILVAGGWWFVKYISTPPPGVEIPDQGRQHVSQEEVNKTVYKSNPPTSGPHLESWVKPGIYEEVQNKGQLIHALEHGYIALHYNCTPVKDMKEATGSAKLDTPDCKTLIKQLSDMANKKKLFKILVVPNPTLDTRIALVAWNHLDKFNEFDAKRVETFIDYWRDHGPEQTME